MEKFTLEILFHIIGIGAASGLIYKDNSLYLISDSSSFLYEYHMDSHDLQRHSLSSNPAENILKKDKPDFEAITAFQDTLYIFGSGSTANRNKMIEYDVAQKKKIATNDLSNLYGVMQNFVSIKPEDFNIEGIVHDGENWYFLNRGNGIANKNTLLSVHAKKLDQEFSLLANDYKLPKIKGVRTSFTDAVLVDNSIYFLGTAENSQSTYEDGAILGSILGRINLETMKIDFTKKISPTNKFEGLTVYAKTEHQIQFLLCEDKDSDVLESAIYKLTIDLK